MPWRSLVPLLRLSLAGYTDAAVNAVSAAWRLAAARGAAAVSADHLAAAMGVGGHPETSPLVLGRCAGFGPDLRAVLDTARAQARGAGCPYVGAPHLVAALAARRPTP